MTDPYTPPTIPGENPLGPWDFSELLRRIAAQQTVVKGTGGAYIVLDLDQNRFSMGDVSTQGAQPKTTVKTNDPKLDEPAFAGLGLWSNQFAQTFLSTILGIEPAPGSVDSISGDDFLEDLQLRQAAMQTFSEEEGLEFPGGTPMPSPPPSENTAFVEWLTELKTTSFNQTAFLSSEMNQVLTTTRSSDEDTVYAELVNLANLPSLSLTDDQKTTIMDRLQKLSKAIAEKNATGGAFVLNSTIPILILTVFSDTVGLSTDTTIPQATKDALFTALSNISSSLATANYESLIHRNPTDQDFLALASKDPQQIGQALAALSGGYMPPSGVSASDVDAALSAIANVLGTLSPEDEAVLESVDRKGLADLFTRALESAVGSGAISDATEKTLLSSLVPLLVDKVYDVNYAEHIENLKSSDPTTLLKSMKILTGIDNDKRITPTTHKIAMSYIQALIAMLSFMAQVRAFISTAEGTFSEKLAQAKIATAEEECNTAMTLYNNELAKITAEYKLNLSKLKQQELMQKLMPLISLGMGGAFLITSVVGLIASILSFGAAAAPTAAALAGLVSAIIGAISATVTFIITCVDSGLQLAGKTSLWTSFANALGITNATEQAAFIAGFQFLTQIATAGITSLVSIGMTSAKAAAEEIVDETIELSSNLIKKAAEDAGKAAATVAKVTVEEAPAVEKTLVSEVEQAVKEASTGIYKASVQQLKRLGFLAALRAGAKAAGKAFDEVSREELAPLMMKLIRQEIVVGALCALIGSGLVTEGLTKLGQLLFHNDEDAMIFTIIMSIAIMALGMYAAHEISIKMNAPSPSGLGVVKEEPSTPDEIQGEAELTPGPKEGLSEAPPGPHVPAQRPQGQAPEQPGQVLEQPGQALEQPSAPHAGGAAAARAGGAAARAGGAAARAGGAAARAGGAAAAHAEEETAAGEGAAAEGGGEAAAKGTGAQQVQPGQVPPPPGVAQPTPPQGLAPAPPGAGAPGLAGVGAVGGGEFAGGGEEGAFGRGAAGTPVTTAAETDAEAAAGVPAATQTTAEAAATTAAGTPAAAATAVPSTDGPPAPGTPATGIPSTAPGAPTTTQPSATGTPNPASPTAPTTAQAAAPTTAAAAAQAAAAAPGAQLPSSTPPTQNAEQGQTAKETSVSGSLEPDTITPLERFRRFLLKVLNDWITKLQDLSKEQAGIQQLAVTSGNVVRGGVAALATLAKKLLPLLTKFLQFIQGLVDKGLAKDSFIAALLTKMEDFVKNLIGTLQRALFLGKEEGALDSLSSAALAWSDIMKQAIVIVKLWASVTNYRLYMKQAELNKLQAELEIDTAQFEAVMQLFKQLSGIDQTQTIQDLGDDISKQFESWTSLIEMVSGFIEGAGEKVTELVSKANK